MDNFISTSYGPQFCVTHKCISKNDQEISKTDNPENIFKEKDHECFRKARHKELYDSIRGEIMFCKDCEQNILSTDIVNQSLKRWTDTVIQGTRAQDNWPDTIISLSPFLYHMSGGCALESDPFWGNNCIRKTLLKYRFEEHSTSHSSSCFKKDCECRFRHPFMATPSTSMFIHFPNVVVVNGEEDKTIWVYLEEQF